MSPFLAKALLEAFQALERNKTELETLLSLSLKFKVPINNATLGSKQRELEESIGKLDIVAQGFLCNHALSHKDIILHLKNF